ncbi:bifunctional glutamate N-acetyltransferase/amino-acid acetyltransferase ArgJ [Gulosibacter molinativorax]|uniref:Arginine biosynthesis bifunctional protein ArgJ n=1 Tax=Gulosibacter molinativorax TaxID=256821 RepID=A0ABT7C8S2_9MICO|nr:bifunctional glutamate N-acetyltransferase/amino-acid acetyltransferase ArgJ [Gulosibacter molinativorax]MDJ1371572.1 bifunctional glutamate N-acetyltransferase/amino-acid acetyltransferase ArgJ [Gulosibacter molinativorax]QUY61085.1 Arginine biosynthesis bifunctional protein ArgJ [Gulosibacter molinativorax]
MTVTTPKGFRAAGVEAGLKNSGGLDVVLVVNDGPSAAAAAVFTENRCEAHPVTWSRKVVGDGTVSAIALNSGGANCFTGEFGAETTRLTAERTAEHLGIGAGDVLVCSTGLIGMGDQGWRDKLLAGLDQAYPALASDEQAGSNAADGILTTDSVRKVSTREGSGYSIGAMAKGAGMLAPGLATMLVVITTDADLESAQLDAALRQATRLTFDRVDSDGCMSTNDTVALMASGASGVTPEIEEFTRLLTEVCAALSKMLQQDAEGASHDITIITTGAASEQEAVDVSRAVSRSNLFKAAIFGNDPNWGRVLAAIGTTSAQFDPQAIDVSMNGIMVCKAGTPHAPVDSVDLTPRATEVLIDLHAGDATATILTNDLTHDYVHENSAYSS